MEHEPVHANVGRLDALVRVALAASSLAGASWVMGTYPRGWWAGGLLLGFVLTAYFLMTATARLDFVYIVMGWDTTRRKARERREARAGKPTRA